MFYIRHGTSITVILAIKFTKPQYYIIHTYSIINTQIIEKNIHSNNNHAIITNVEYCCEYKMVVNNSFVS